MALAGQRGGRREQRVGPSETPDPAPLIALRLELQRAREQHRAFDDAWACAMAHTLPADDWLAVLDEHRAVWRAAYNRTGPVFALSAPDEP